MPADQSAEIGALDVIEKRVPVSIRFLYPPRFQSQAD